MCGFAVIYGKGGTAKTIDRRIAQMGNSIQHRGPDERGTCRAGPVSFAHCRLAIIDLVGGQQPMRSRDGRNWLAYNGEIYNYREIRAELKDLGFCFSGQSDTEVLLTAWQHWGTACLDRLNGMFVLAVYDAESGVLTAARDRFGEKPLYFCEDSEAIYLASELKALVAAGVVDKRVDRSALYSYLTLGYVVGEQAIFRNVRRLRPGHLLTFSPGSDLVQRPWYHPPRPSAVLHDSEAVTEQSLSLLRESVSLRLVADVPVGCFLSGGVDSSAVVALASEVTSGRLETFSIGFSDPRYDERPYARIVAERFNTCHHEFVVKPQGVDVLERVAWHADEPFADQAALPTWFLSELTRQHVKVALSGDGGDEFFAGYDVYRGHALSERVRQIPAVLRAVSIIGLRASARLMGDGTKALRLARNIEDAGLEATERFIAKQQSVFRTEYLQENSTNLSGPFEQFNRSIFSSLYGKGLQPLDAIAVWQQGVSLPDDMLHKVDRMSMAHGLEVRTPFLDHRLGELLNRTDLKAKLPHGKQKYILRKAMERYLPYDLLWRGKQGFVVPLAQWFKDDLAVFIQDALLVPTAPVHGVIPRSVIESIVFEHRSGSRDWSAALWALLMFHLWSKSYGLTLEDVIGT